MMAQTNPHAGRRLQGFWRGAVLAFAAVGVASCTSGSSETPDRIAQGEELYQANCASCHGGATGGDVADIPPPHNAQGHTWHHPDCLLVELIQDGMPPRPGLPEDAPTMPPFGDELGDEDIRAILAYIKTWWTEDQQESQQEVTDQTCD